MSLSNGEKAEHGSSAQEALGHALNQLLNAGYFESIQSPYRIGKVGYLNDVQFYAPFHIKFNDGSEWILYSTTSMRSDRIKGQQWDALNIKLINEKIDKAFVVYPDGLESELRRSFIYLNNKFINGEDYSKIDGIVSQNEICNLIEQNAIKSLNFGQIKDRQGNFYEDRVAFLLSNSNNLLKWKSHIKTIEGVYFDTFCMIVDIIGLHKDDVESIIATSDKKIIGRLPSGGNPKTDVLITVKQKDATVKKYTISCKRSSDKKVSVHQYTANSFADVLGASNELRDLLVGFQSAGSLSAFGQSNINRLTEALMPYEEKLSMWVLGGFGGEGNEEQCANYILTYDNNTGTPSIHTINDYYHMLKEAGVIGNFGTIFSWTYPSGRRGQSIQLKCAIL